MDSTAQCNRGAYHLWHVVITDCNGRGGSVYYGFIDNESGDSYNRALEHFSRVMPNVEKLKTVVLDKSAAQLKAVRQHLPWVTVHFCSFHVAQNFMDKLNGLHITCVDDHIALKRCLMGLLYSGTQNEFNVWLEDIKRKSPVLDEYLQRQWLPYVTHWAAYARKSDLNFGNGTNNRVESANRYIKANLSPSSSL